MSEDVEAACGFPEDSLNAYLDREASPEEKGRVEAHLRACDSCAKTLNDLKATKALLKNLEVIAAPSILWEKIQEEIRREKVIQLPPARRTAGRLTRFTAAAAAVLLFLFAAVTLIGVWSPQPPSATENPYMASHAYHISRLPLSDRASWNYITEEAGFAIVNNDE